MVFRDPAFKGAHLSENVKVSEICFRTAGMLDGPCASCASQDPHCLQPSPLCARALAPTPGQGQGPSPTRTGDHSQATYSTENTQEHRVADSRCTRPLAQAQDMNHLADRTVAQRPPHAGQVRATQTRHMASRRSLHSAPGSRRQVTVCDSPSL